MRGHIGTLVIWGLALVAAYWLVLLVIADWQDATWPEPGDRRQNLIVFSAIVSFLLLKTFLMAARTLVPTRLGASLIVTNLAFALIYAYASANILWPGLGLRHPWMPDGLRWLIALAVAWGTIELILTPDPPEEEADPWALLAETTEEAERLRQENIMLRAKLHAGYD